MSNKWQLLIEKANGSRPNLVVVPSRSDNELRQDDLRMNVTRATELLCNASGVPCPKPYRPGDL